jgi:hypothetical protein
VIGAAWWAATRIEVGVGDLVHRTRDGHSTGRVLGGQMIEMLGDTVCSLYRAQGDEESRFLSSALKPRSMVSPVLASKPVATVLVVWRQNHSIGFPG